MTLYRSGRPATATTQENIDHVHRIVMDDRRLTEYQIAIAVDNRYIPKTSICSVGTGAMAFHS